MSTHIETSQESRITAPELAKVARVPEDIAQKALDSNPNLRDTRRLVETCHKILKNGPSGDDSDPVIKAASAYRMKSDLPIARKQMLRDSE